VPSESLADGLDKLKFDNETMGPMIEVGKKDAENTLKMGENRVFGMLNEWSQDEEKKKNYPYFEDYIASFLLGN